MTQPKWTPAVGDLVRVEGGLHSSSYAPYLVGHRARILEVDLNYGRFKIEVISLSAASTVQIGTMGWVSRRQCRRLIKKPRREWWVNPIYIPSDCAVTLRDVQMRIVTTTKEEPGFIRVREVRRKK